MVKVNLKLKVKKIERSAVSLVFKSAPPQSQRTLNILQKMINVQATSKYEKFTPKKAAQCGHFEMIKHFLQQGKCTSDVANYAAGGGYIEIVRFLRSHDIHCTGTGANMAAGNGHLEMVRDLLQHHIHCTYHGINAAARNGHMHMIRYFRDELRTAFKSTAPDMAAGNGQLDMVRYFRALNIHCTSHGADEAAKNGHLEVIQDLRANGVHCSHMAWFYVIDHGQLEVLKDLISNGVTLPFRDWTILLGEALMFCQLEIVQYLRSIGTYLTPGCDDIDNLDMAAGKGTLDLLQDVFEHDGVLPTSHGANYAAFNGHLHIIHFLRAHGVHCNARGANGAASRGQLDVIRDLRANGIHCTRKGLKAAKDNNHVAVIEDLQAHGIR